MPVIWKDFDRYSFTYVGGKWQGGLPGADIICYRSNSRVALIRFLRDDTAIPASQLLSDGTIMLYYEMSRFNDVITILRYEKPLYVAVNTDTGFGYIAPASLEPIGEQEPV